MITLEICAGSLVSAIAAAQGKASRIELCSALTVGGLTPGVGLLQTVKSLIDIPVHVLIRPRAGNFTYSKHEKRCILQEIEACIKAGADGVVIGALNADSSIDTDFMKEAVYCAAELDCTFHRAFDVITDKTKALDEIINLGFDRILTSGGQQSAWDGREIIRQLIVQAADTIEIMPGSGIHVGNAAQIVEYTGARAIHTSAKGSNSATDDSMFAAEPETDAVSVRNIVDILEKYSQHLPDY